MKLLIIFAVMLVVKGNLLSELRKLSKRNTLCGTESCTQSWQSTPNVQYPPQWNTNKQWQIPNQWQLPQQWPAPQQWSALQQYPIQPKWPIQQQWPVLQQFQNLPSSSIQQNSAEPCPLSNCEDLTQCQTQLPCETELPCQEKSNQIQYPCQNTASSLNPTSDSNCFQVCMEPHFRNCCLNNPRGNCGQCLSQPINICLQLCKQYKYGSSTSQNQQ